MKVLLVASLLTVASMSWAADLPRYKLQVGRELTYSQTMNEKQLGAKEGTTSTSEAMITVVAQNADGTVRVIIHVSEKFGDQPAREIFAYADVFPDGRFKPNGSVGPEVELDQLFPKLPATNAEATSQWQEHFEFGATTITYSPIKNSGDQFSFGANYDRMINKLYDSKRTATIQFDTSKGIMSEEEILSSQDYGFHSKAAATRTLTKDVMLDGGMTELLGRDYQAFCTADEQYMDCLRKISDDPGSAQQLCDQGKAILMEAEKNVKADEVRAEFDRMLKAHDEMAAREVEDGKKELGILNKPAGEWTATDLDGKEWKLADLRGKVVLMDFWYRGCGWCMYATPQVKQLAEEYKDKGVVVFGMNTDENEADAKFVVSTFDLSYPQLKATEIAKQYEVHAFPTLMIIDQQGVLRGIHVGYTATLHDEVAKRVDALLASAK